MIPLKLRKESIHHYQFFDIQELRFFNRILKKVSQSAFVVANNDHFLVFKFIIYESVFFVFYHKNMTILSEQPYEDESTSLKPDMKLLTEFSPKFFYSW